jgi:ketosteroid isomerase-like protein
VADSRRANVVRQYLTAMDLGDYLAASALFAEDARYRRPLITEGGNAPVLQVIVGRDAIVESWKRRGRREIRHDVATIAEFGDHVFSEGVATLGDGHRLAFVTYVTFDADDRFAEVTAHSALLPDEVDQDGDAR